MDRARLARTVAEVVRATLAAEQSTGNATQASDSTKDALQQLATAFGEWDWGYERTVEDVLVQYLHDISVWAHLAVRKPLTAMRVKPQPQDYIEHIQPSPVGADDLEDLLQKLIGMCARVDRIHSHASNAHCESVRNQPRKVSESEKVMLLGQMLEYERTHVHYGLPKPSGEPFSFHCNRPVLAKEDMSSRGFVHLELGFHKCIDSLMDDFLVQTHRGFQVAADNALGDRLKTVDIILTTLAPYFVADNQEPPNS